MSRLGVNKAVWCNLTAPGVLAGLTNVWRRCGLQRIIASYDPHLGKLIWHQSTSTKSDEAYRNDRFVFEEVIWSAVVRHFCLPRSKWMIFMRSWQSYTVPCRRALWIP